MRSKDAHKQLARTSLTYVLYTFFKVNASRCNVNVVKVNVS